MNSYIIEVQNVQKTFKVREKSNNILEIINPKYKSIVAVDDISFNVKQGEMLGYLGSNGSGKSTTIKMLTGILKPTAGEIIIDGYNPVKDREKLSQNIGVLFGQRTQLWWALPFRDSLNAIKAIYNIPDIVFKRNLELFREMVGIDELLNKTIRQMSLGQRMLCEIIATFIHNPKIVFLDEPTIGLDIVVKDKIRELIRTINKERNTTVILTSHDMKDVEKICNRLLIIENGKIIFGGDIDDIYKVYKQKQKILIRTDDVTSDVIKIINNELLNRGRCFMVDSKNIVIEIYRYSEIDYCLNGIVNILNNLIKIQNIVVLNYDLESVVKDIYKGAFNE